MQMKRLLEMLRHDDCEDPVICDCSLPVVHHLNAEDDAADFPAAAPCGAVEPQSSPVRPCGPLNVDDMSRQQQMFSSASDLTPPNSSTAARRDVTSDRCRTFKLPDVQVRLTSPQQSAGSDRVGDPSTTVVSRPDVINDRHYTVV